MNTQPDCVLYFVKYVSRHKLNFKRGYLSIKTGVWQDCLLFLFPFGHWLDCERIIIREKKWNPVESFALAFANDLALLSDTYYKMQKNPSILAENASKTRLQINKEKAELMIINTNHIISIKNYNTCSQIENLILFIYLGNVVHHQKC